MKRILDVIDKVTMVLAYTSGALVIVMMLSMVYDVVMRHIFNRPTIWADELSCFLLVGVSFLGAAYALKTDSHVRIETFVGLLPPRVKNFVETVTDVLSVAFLFIFAWQGGRLVFESFVYTRIAPTLLRTPLYLPQAFLAAGLSWFFVQMLAHTLKRFVTRQAKGGRE
jgi:C4-dicarboxylate transporter DctQ subunit